MVQSSWANTRGCMCSIWWRQVCAVIARFLISLVNLGGNESTQSTSNGDQPPVEAHRTVSTTMAVEATNRSSTMDPQVSEATAALKGMLGLGPPPEKSEPQAEKPKNKKKGNKKPPQPNKQQQDNDSAAKTPNPPTGKKKKKKKGKKEENFAWSAFQASPDASKLPIPAFGSPAPATAAKEESTLTEGQDIVAIDGKEAVEETKEGSEDDAPASSTGVNLAALSSNPPTPQEHPQPSPPNQFLPMQQLPPPMQQQYGPPFPNYPPSYNPGFITIQVQVPPALLPGRQMLVSTPAGFPVRVTVPDHVPAGSIIPVHVPTQPPHMSPQFNANYYPPR